MTVCADVARTIVYPYLCKTLDARYVIDRPVQGCWCFRITLPSGAPVFRMSVSVPPDAHGNRVQDFAKDVKYVPSTYETALIGADDKLVYIDSLGYWDVERFSSLDELVKEIKRIGDVVTVTVNTTANTSVLSITSGS